MSTLPSPASGPAIAPSKGNRGLLIVALVVLLVVCMCVVIVGALGAGLFLSGKLGTIAQTSPTPVAVIIATLSPEASSTAVSSATAASSPTTASSPTAVATAVPTTASTPTPTISSGGNQPWANWPTILSDSFVSNTNGWNVKDRSSDRITTKENIGAGKMHVEAQATQGTESERYPTGPSVSDFYLEVSVTQQSGPTTNRYGPIFRLDASSNDDYFFSVSNDGTFRVSLYQGGWTNLIDPTKSSAIHAGQSNRLAVLAQGAHLVFYINDEQVGTVDSSALTKGLPGVAFELDANTQGVFDYENFQLRAPTGAAVPTPGQTGLPTPTP